MIHGFNFQSINFRLRLSSGKYSGHGRAVGRVCVSVYIGTGLVYGVVSMVVFFFVFSFKIKLN